MRFWRVSTIPMFARCIDLALLHDLALNPKPQAELSACARSSGEGSCRECQAARHAATLESSEPQPGVVGNEISLTSIKNMAGEVSLLNSFLGLPDRPSKSEAGEGLGFKVQGLVFRSILASINEAIDARSSNVRQSTNSMCSTTSRLSNPYRARKPCRTREAA